MPFVIFEGGLGGGGGLGDKNGLIHSCTRLEPREGELKFVPKSLGRCEGGTLFWTKSQRVRFELFELYFISINQFIFGKFGLGVLYIITP